MQSPESLIEVSSILKIQTRTSDGADNGSTAIDLQGKGFEYIMFEVTIGTLSALNSLIVKVQESDDNSTWTDVTGATMTMTNADDDSVALGLIRTRGKKRYVRTNHTSVDGGGSGIVFGINAHSWGAQYPIDNSAGFGFIVK